MFYSLLCRIHIGPGTRIYVGRFTEEFTLDLSAKELCIIPLLGVKSCLNDNNDIKLEMEIMEFLMRYLAIPSKNFNEFHNNFL